MKPSDSLAGGQPTGPKAPVHPAPLALARVPFRGGFIEAAQLDGEVWVPIRPVCEALGVSQQGQLAKLRAKPWATIKMIFTVADDGKARQLAAVDLRSLPLWLATIEPSRVKPEARPALVAYQREAADVLYRHFLAPTPTAALPSANLQAAHEQLSQTLWALGLPSGGSTDGTDDPAIQLASTVAHLATLVGFAPSGELPFGVLIPRIDSRSQTVLRMRAWLTECARPLTNEERQERPSRRGITAQQASESYNRWALGRGFAPLSALNMGRWLTCSDVCGYRRIICRKGHRYQLALLTDRAPQLAGGCA